jgi:hypothetical protein
MPSPEDDCPANLKQIIRELETVLPPLPRSGSVQQCAAPQQPLALQFTCGFLHFVSFLVCPPFTASGAAVGELDR